MIFLTASINHFAGTNCEISCIIHGIDSSGNIMPDNIITGSIIAIPETSNADICVAAKVEIKTPMANERKI